MSLEVEVDIDALIAAAQARLDAALAERPTLDADNRAKRRAHEDANNAF